MKLFRQLAVIGLLIAAFLVIDFSIYHLVIKRYQNHISDGMQAKSIELTDFLPFDENSKVVRVETDVKLTGDLPVLDGAAALYPIFSAVANAVYPKESVSFDGKNFTKDSALQFHNTRGSYQAIVDGTVDLIICAKPSKEQLAYAKEKGVELELVPIGKEAFVFIVNSENPVDNLTLEQVRGIYSGRYKSWEEVGGDHYRIDALQRNEGSGSQTRMLAFMDGEPMKKDPLGFLGRSIGFSFRYYVSGIVENSGVKMLSLEGVYPSKENIVNGTYPIVNDFYAVYRKDDPNPNIPILMDFILSEEGQRIVEESGYVPVR